VGDHPIRQRVLYTLFPSRRFFYIGLDLLAVRGAKQTARTILGAADTKHYQRRVHFNIHDSASLASLERNVTGLDFTIKLVTLKHRITYSTLKEFVLKKAASNSQKV
jgi:hypothetical protein